MSSSARKVSRRWCSRVAVRWRAASAAACPASMAPVSALTSTRARTSPASGCTSYSSTSVLPPQASVTGWNARAAARIPGGSAAGQPHDRDEEVVDLADDLDEALEVHRLGDVGVRVEVVAAQDVLLRVGGREDDDGDAAQLGVGLELAEHL